MEISYLTGKGFVGKHLFKALEGRYIVHIPHEEIQTTKIKSFDNFYYLSSYGNLSFQEDEDEIFKANVLDLMTILKQIRNVDFHSFVYISSSSVRLKVQTTYSRCKRIAEEILLAFMEKHNKPVTIIRPLSITGVGEQNCHLIPTLIRSCLKGEHINFVPEPTHDYINVDDIVSGIMNLSNHQARGIFELGTGKNSSNQEVLDIVEKVTGKKANINIVPSMRGYDNADWVSNNYKARGYGWLAKKTLEDSIKEMVEEAKK